MSRYIAAATAALLLAFLLFAGCSEADKAAPPEQPEKETKPEEKGEEPAEKAPDGKALLQERCTRCHGLDKVENHAKVDREHWAETVDEMMKKGAKLTDEERNILLDYLAGQ